jgi:hypothetical protein
MCCCSVNGHCNCIHPYTCASKPLKDTMQLNELKTSTWPDYAVRRSRGGPGVKQSTA